MNSVKTTSGFNDTGTGSSRSLLLVSIILGLAALVTVTATIDDIGINYDEPNYYNSCRQQIAWFRQAAQDFSSGNWSAPFSPEVIDRYWNFQPIYNVHPPFYKLCSSLTLTMFEGWLGPMGAYRLAPAVMFSLLVALLFATVGRRYGMVAGFWAAGAFALMPRIFGHAHFGCADMPLALLWFASAVSFHRALESRKWAPVFALVYGLALATKFTAFVVVLPLVVFVLISRRFKQAAWPVGIALVVSPLIMIGLNPQWWHNTLERVYIYLVDSATRSEYLCIPTYYLDKQYYFNLPWHHPVLLAIFTVPPLVLAGFIYGLGCIARRPFSDLWASHMLLHWLGLIFVMMLPSSPGHDGVRLFLPAFAFLVVVSAKGFQYFVSRSLPRLLARIHRPPGQGKQGTLYAWLLLGAMMVPSTVTLAKVHPHELCYYNSLAGGIGGAYDLGMESTCMWDPFNNKACQLINDTLPDSAAVFAMNNNHYLFLQGLGKIKPSLKFNNEKFDYILQYSRQGMFEDLDWVLFRHGKPLAELKVDGVRLFALFQYPQVFEQIPTALEGSKSLKAFYEKAVVYQWIGRLDRANLELEKCLKQSPGDFDANMRMAELFLEKNLPDKAIAHLKQIGDIEKGSKTWHYYMGMALSRLGKKEQADASFQHSLESRSLHSSPVLINADIYYQMGKLTEAASQYELVLRTHRSDEIAYHMLGLINHRLEETERAKYYYQKLLNIIPKHFETLYNMGLLESEAGNSRQAEEYFNRALEADSTGVAAHFQLARLLAESGENARAVEHLKIVLAKHPDDIQSHSMLAKLFLQDPARQAEALEHFRILARLSPEQAEFIEEEFIRPLQEKLARSAGTP